MRSWYHPKSKPWVRVQIWTDRHSISLTQMYFGFACFFNVCSTFTPCVFHHGEVFAQPQDHDSASKSSNSLGVWAVMVLTLGFVDIDCAWHYRASGTLPTSFGNKDTLLILHKCIQDETQTYKDSELNGHKPEAAEQQSKRLPVLLHLLTQHISTKTWSGFWLQLLWLEALFFAFPFKSNTLLWRGKLHALLLFTQGLLWPSNQHQHSSHHV